MKSNFASKIPDISFKFRDVICRVSTGNRTSTETSKLLKDYFDLDRRVRLVHSISFICIIKLNARLSSEHSRIEEMITVPVISSFARLESIVLHCKINMITWLVETNHKVRWNHSLKQDFHTVFKVLYKFALDKVTLVKFVGVYGT